ncbi:MAG: hypothetical protein J6C64_09385 [Lachnospiraceae bacterium]|nr:hypothetical protein [Lachnospiraceae bacterium]
MERKAKTGMNAWLIIGIVFTIVGAVFSITMVGLFFVFKDIDPMTVWLFLPIFGLLGLIFLVLGLIFLINDIKKRRRSSRLLNSGNYIMAEITEVTFNGAVRVNGMHPFIIKCIYQDMAGNIHIFKSRDLFFDPRPLLKDQQVKVYVDADNFNHYYVDVDSVLPQVINH